MAQKNEVRTELLDLSGGEMAREVLWQQDRRLECEKMRKIHRNEGRWRETEKGKDRQGDGDIYSRLVVMVISRRERRV